MTKTQLGRHVFGLVAIGLGICTLIWRDFIWQNEPPIKIADIGILVECIGVVQIGGGLAIQFRRSARAGAVALALVYAVFALLWLPPWIRKPLVFDYLGNAFEQFALLCGALIVYGRRTARVGYYGFAVSVISFAIYQAIHLGFTASLVPKWIPPGQMFWAVVTTIAFALAALALLSGRFALLAARLTTLMLAGFGVLVWVPATLSSPHNLGDWSELGLTFGICAAAWIVADYL
jgi:hypothetical protein